MSTARLFTSIVAGVGLGVATVALILAIIVFNVYSEHEHPAELQISGIEITNPDLEKEVAYLLATVEQSALDTRETELRLAEAAKYTDMLYEYYRQMAAVSISPNPDVNAVADYVERALAGDSLLATAWDGFLEGELSQYSFDMIFIARVNEKLTEALSLPPTEEGSIDG